MTRCRATCVVAHIPVLRVRCKSDDVRAVALLSRRLAGCLHRFLCIIYIVKYLIIGKRQYCGTINALGVIS